MVNKSLNINIIISTLFAEKEIIESIINENIEQVENVVQAIVQCSGKVVFSGIGKSALVAQSLAATFNSTGTSAAFMHATDAIHGDFGMLKAEDLVFYISKSGEGSEVVAFLDGLQNLDHRNLIALTSNTKSDLYKRAKFVILMPNANEADALNLVPTVSIIGQLAIGHAIAIAVMHANQFSPKDFANLHPGGSLGKKLHAKVSELMDPNKLPKVFTQSTIKDVVFTITENRLGACAVFDGNILVGIVTDGDIRRAFSTHDNVLMLNAESLMSTNPIFVSFDCLAIEAFQKMKQYKVNQLIVKKENEYCGMIHIQDLASIGFQL